jgi:RNA-directed DNA polymerase
VERVWSEQDEGGQRPLGQPACEDKLVQSAGARLLAALDEPDFDDGSYGFRQGRSPQAARQELRQRGMTEGRGWSVEAEVSGDGASIARPRQREGRRQRGQAGRLLRRLGKWVRAGVMAQGARGRSPRQVSSKAGAWHPCWPMSSALMSSLPGVNVRNGHG